jgi:hypothetical protein
MSEVESGCEPRLASDLRRRSVVKALSLGLLLLPAVVGWLVWQPGGFPASVSQAAPSESATPTLAPNTGAVAGLAWDDLDGNAVRDDGEPPLPGMQLALQPQGGGTPRTAVTGSDGTYRFSDLPSGFYRLDATPPVGYQLTTSGTFNLYVSVGTVLALEFGAQFVPTPTPTDTPIPRLDIDNAPLAMCGGVILGDTHVGQSNVSRYTCQPAWDESGPELVYRIELGRSQTLTAAIITSTVDLDLFLLTSAYPDTCLVGGDNYLAHSIQPGVYFLAVDGYQGATGQFQIRLECPYEPQATATPTRTPSPTPTATRTYTPSPTFTPTATQVPSRRYLPLALRAYAVVTPPPVTLTFQQGTNGYTGMSDTTLYAWYPDQVWGADPVLRLRYNQQTAPIVTHMAPLLHFDLALVPAEAHIVTATLSLYLTEPPKYDERGAVHALLRAWDERTATWNQPRVGFSWAVAGAQGSGTDHTVWASDAQYVEAGNRWYSFDVSDFVRGWITNPGSNYGVILLAQSGISESNVEAGFASREYSDPLLRPKLSVSYWIEPVDAVSDHQIAR